MTRQILGEHGFSALIEIGQNKILMDTGQGFALKHNANALKIDLSSVDTIVLSHGHYDHTGGLVQLVPFNRKTRIIAHPEIFDPKYVKIAGQKNESFQYAGIPISKKDLVSDPDCELLLQEQFQQISDQIYFSGQVPRVTEFEGLDKRLKLKSETGFTQDHFFDDTSLLIETLKGPVILTGCAHSGIVNVMKHFEKMTGYDRFYGVIGGTHLGFLNSDEQLEKTMDAFEAYDLELIAVSHCTGNEAASACHNRFTHKFDYANAGWSISL